MHMIAGCLTLKSTDPSSSGLQLLTSFNDPSLSLDIKMDLG